MNDVIEEKAVKEIQKLLLEVLANQLNMAKVVKRLHIRLSELEERQNPGKHNEIVEDAWNG